MLVLGGSLKRRESLSGRLADVFGSLYLASTVLKHFENQGRQESDLPLVEWACRQLLYQAQEQLHGFLRNFPNRLVAAGLRAMIFPLGRMYSAPSDKLAFQIVDLVTHPTPSRERLTEDTYIAKQESNPLGMLQAALELAEHAAPLEKKIRDAVKAGLISGADLPAQIDAALAKGVLIADEAEELRHYDAAVMALVAVDDFGPEAFGRPNHDITP